MSVFALKAKWLMLPYEMKGRDFLQVSVNGFGNAFIVPPVSRYKARPVSLMSDLEWDYISAAPLSSSMVGRWECRVLQVRAPRSGLPCLLRSKAAETKRMYRSIEREYG